MATMSEGRAAAEGGLWRMGGRAGVGEGGRIEGGGGGRMGGGGGGEVAGGMA